MALSKSVVSMHPVCLPTYFIVVWILIGLTCVRSQESESSISWIISRTTTCKDTQQIGCGCETSLLKPKPHTKITCSCEASSPSFTKVAYVHGSNVSQDAEPNHDIIWIVENCPNVTVMPSVLPTGSGVEMTLAFRNVTNLQIKESAFSTAGPNVAFSSPSVLFEECGIDSIPSKGFPSNLERITFLRSRVGKIHSHAFKQVYINEMNFMNTTIEDMSPNAFDQDLQSWKASNSHFKRIQTNAITGGISSMSWSTCTVDHLDSSAFGALIPRIDVNNSQFYFIDTNGLAIQEWTTFNLVNNVFHRVKRQAIDLSQRSGDAAHRALLKNNVWWDFSPDFIYTGSTEEVSCSLENNTVMHLCDCDLTSLKAKMVTLESSASWFLQEFVENTKCFVTEKTGTECLGQNNTFILMSELTDICQNFTCFRDSYQFLDDFPSPQLPDRLKILAIFIGTLTGAIVVSLLITMCVFLMKRGERPKGSETSDITKSFGAPQDFSDVVYKMSQHGQTSLPPPQQQPPPPPMGSSFRPRSILLEDVEMEDKGVQTMPSEISSDMLEGLRDKLSKPESFWDAKKTIDHLYGLMQVQSSTPSIHTSPPDVTMHNHQRALKTSTLAHPPSLHASTSTSHHPSTLHHSHFNHVPGGMTKSLTTSFVSNPKNPAPSTRYAQIQKPKTVLTAVCDYGDPSDSHVHIYSELNGHRSRSKEPQQLPQSTFSHKARPLPMLCEYNEPKDVQSHVYAELTGMIASPHLINSAAAINPSFREQQCQTMHQEPATTVTQARNSTTKPQHGFNNTPQPTHRPLPDPPLLSPV